MSRQPYLANSVYLLNLLRITAGQFQDGELGCLDIGVGAHLIELGPRRKADGRSITLP